MATATFTTAAASETKSQYTPLLPVQKPVPEDIVIAQSVAPVHISKVADELGLHPNEVDLYGQHKAKVRDYGCLCVY
jgi:hypothetical protein